MNKGRNFGAQRKFAAGACTRMKSKAPLETPTETSPDPVRQLRYVKKKPANLLDRLAFNDIHKHIQPVVVLERLQTNQLPNAQLSQNVATSADDPEIVMICDSDSTEEMDETLLIENSNSSYIKPNTRKDRETRDRHTNKQSHSGDSTSDDEIPIRKKQKMSILEAPVFRPTVDEFKEPLTYIEKILPEASKYGLCKVIPPDGFTPPCNLDGTMNFNVTNHYVQRMFKRYGPAAKKLTTFKAVLASQKVTFRRPPLLSGLEVDLAYLFKLVQQMGGLKKLTKIVQWNKVADQLKLCRHLKNPGQKIKQIYEKYLLPYEVMTTFEKENLIEQVDLLCEKSQSRMSNRARSPLHAQRQMLEPGDSTDNDSCDEISAKDHLILNALAETDDCIVPGRSMNLYAFQKVAEVASNAFLSSTTLKTKSIEKAYWDVVLSRTKHVCVNAASIDTGAADYGFPNNDSTDHYSRHPWNLKCISRDIQNMLSFLGPVVGMTAPTLHLGMLFSTSCWHRDPHGLPWIEYMHSGKKKVWYGIDDSQSDTFRIAVERLCPAFVQNKSVWLPSDIAMIPPDLLQDSVSLCRAVQNPGEFIIVCPKAYSSSIATGYTISESVYFATLSWIHCLGETFDTLKSSCEPTMFSLEQLLFAFVRDARTPPSVLRAIEPILKEVLNKEFSNRQKLEEMGLTKAWLKPYKPSATRAWNVSDQDECYICRMTLYLSRVRGVFDKNSVLCLEHAIKVLQQPNKSHLITETKRLSFIIMYSTNELKELLEFLKERLRRN
ncbi:protein Jumonji [Pieris rapae]|uniref:protein Jumonji n=1 Tax=Pieris rapae TaxID=64459 RepID=UPI000B92805F|nr:protein Jumonji [Pieris rapae]